MMVLLTVMVIMMIMMMMMMMMKRIMVIILMIMYTSTSYSIITIIMKVKGDYNKAVDDLNKAVDLDPSNIDYRQQRALLFRITGDYLHAVNETLYHRYVVTLQ